MAGLGTARVSMTVLAATPARLCTISAERTAGPGAVTSR